MLECAVEKGVPPWRDADRLAALRSFGILDTEPEAAFDDVVKLAAEICGAPVAAVNFIDRHRQWLKAAVGVDVRETPLDMSICIHAIRQPGLFIVPDAAEDPRFRGNPAVLAEPGVRFYAGAVLSTEEGLPLGTVCVVDYVPRPQGLTDGQAEALYALARVVMRELRIRRDNRILVWRERGTNAIADALPHMAWIARSDGHHEFRNKRYHQFTGAPPGTIDGDGWKNVVHGDDRERVLAAWNHAVRTGEPYEAEYRLRHHSGAYRWVLARALPIKGQAGQVDRWIGTCTDVHAWKEAERRVAESEERLRLAVETTGLGIWDADLVTGRRQWSAEARTILGIGPEVPTTRDTFLERIHPEDRARMDGKFFAHDPASHLAYDDECRILRADTGEERWVAVTGQTLFDGDGRAVRKIGTIQDVTERRRAQDALRASEERLQLALQAARMVAWEQDLVTNHISRSGNALELLGVASGPLEEFLERVPVEDRAHRERFLERIRAEGADTMEFRYTLPEGKTLWLASRAQRTDGDRVVGVTFDISDRKAAEEEIWRTANHDALTGLPNRVLFQRCLEQALAQARPRGTGVSLLLIDLDDFKDVNDTLGHDAGDALLQETAARLAGTVRDGDTVARLGGDEFAVLVVDTQAHPVTSLAETITKRVRQPFTYNGRMIVSRASIGIASFPEHDAAPAELMKDAGIALYQAKREGRGRVVTYSADMRTAAEQRLALRREVKEAIARDQLLPFYQPKVCLSTGQVVGLEALARWQHPTKGLLTPGAFAAAFDDPELVTAFSKRLIGKIASDVRQWLKVGLNPGRVAVNLSSAEFSQLDLADEVLRILRLAKVPTQHFEVEVTEKVLLDGRSGLVLDTLERFHRKGVQVALDDFGTGYASLTHLKEFPVDHIKIDQSFVRGLGLNGDDAAIVAAVITLGRSLNLEVTAEGVETEEQARRLREMGCDRAQGYLYARPMPGSEIRALLPRMR
ncbi:bifunctional diguanylate cyclase/phosphodiesterase [Microvirga arsenatis]|uniref:EAL domain-containing protein n=1 Tax=Microvirga arsenatis TaxID=2692265 RepID=A0ABW9Z072_9HYPH|nr:EAL domain-containing protein [Microvirga arsenatis]NBJ12250.1 EAL domain-containing protein [Microvirga arsenatis]NBJ26041.1 EAL domain-containing protein [Microvirga arsenatis]